MTFLLWKSRTKMIKTCFDYIQQSNINTIYNIQLKCSTLEVIKKKNEIKNLTIKHPLRYTTTKKSAWIFSEINFMFQSINKESSAF